VCVCVLKESTRIVDPDGS